MAQLPKQYAPQEHERTIYQQWEDARAFVADATSSKEPFVISMPPPNATGELHMGHASFLTIQDIIVRYMRMRGRETLWLPGTDHAAIATENVVLRNIKKEERIRDPRTELGREEVLRRIAQYVEQSRATIQTQIRSLGASCDWSRERYTLDSALSRSVNEVFKRMYDDGLIYRGARIVNWDRQLQTTVSDDEIEWQEEKTPLYTFQYGPFEITTARPETKFGDKYVVMHPDDTRYQQFQHGETFTAEWINGPVTATVIKDAAVDPTFGTGVMTITPWHDAVDFEIAERHSLDREPIIGFDGTLLPIAGEFAGQTIAEARPVIVKKLEEKGLLIKTDDTYVHNVAVSSRGGGVIEPQIKLQWFIDVNKQAVSWQGKTLSLKEVLQLVVKAEDITLFPERFTTVYFQWIDNLRDWCISRQIWWGHRVPVWYRQADLPRMGFDGKIVQQVLAGKTKTYRLRDYGYAKGQTVLLENTQTKRIFGEAVITDIVQTTVGEVDLADQAHYTTYDSQAQLIAAFKKYHPQRDIDGSTPVWIYQYTFTPREEIDFVQVSAAVPKGEGWEQDTDTLDTWFSSAMWTWSTLIDPALAQDQTLTLEELLERSPDYQKFHPTTLMETGFDILFFWVARMILVTTYTTGQIPFKHVYLNGLVRTKSGKKMSKSDPSTMINPVDLIERHGADATRFGLAYNIQYDSQTIPFDERAVIQGRNFATKLWNIARLHETLPERTEETVADIWIQQRLAQVGAAVAERIAAYDVGEAARQLYYFVWSDYADWYLEILKVEGSTALARQVLFSTLQLLHPFMPFVTEALWQHFEQPGLLMQSAWPTFTQLPPNTELSRDMARFKDFVETIRSARSLLAIDTVTVVLPTPTILPRSLEAISSATIVEAAGKPVARFHSPHGILLLSSPEITSERLAVARQQLEQERAQKAAVLAQQEAVLQRMQSKASPENVREKELLVRGLKASQAELEQSLHLLQED